MAWIIPEHKLDPQQREFIEKQDYTRRNIWIKGFPGSGKSVLLAYTLKQIKSRTPDASVVAIIKTFKEIITVLKECIKPLASSKKASAHLSSTFDNKNLRLKSI